MHMKRAYVDTRSGQVNYYDSGQGQPLLMIHQALAAATESEAAWPLLIAAGHRVLALDLPGFGYSDAPVDPPTILDYADAALAVLDHAGVDAADVAGHHTGVQVAFELAARDPDRVRSIIAQGVPLNTPEEAEAGWARSVPREQAEPMFSAQPDGEHLIQAFRRIRGYGASPECAQQFLMWSLLAGRTLWYGHNASYRHDVVPPLMATRGPILLVSYALESLHAKTLRARELRPDARLHLIDWTPSGQQLIIERPDLWCAAVIPFLREVASSPGGEI